MTLKDIFAAVREKKLTKQQLEDYHFDLTSLYGDMQFSLAEIRKKNFGNVMLKEMFGSAHVRHIFDFPSEYGEALKGFYLSLV